ncbi:MAG TPA: PH domain-containing protein, partial [Polyangia bacterium]|nr:PH domain-containing protein [Polyangia bacterium]
MTNPQNGGPPTEPELRFVSARDTWVVVLLWISAAIVVASMGPVFCAPIAGWMQLGSLLLSVASGGLMLWLLYGTDYVLGGDTLRIRSGPFRWRVRLDRIVEVVPSRNPLSSPACSLDRLHIRYTGSRRGILISPEDRSRFLQTLAARSPQLRFEGDR